MARPFRHSLRIASRLFALFKIGCQITSFSFLVSFFFFLSFNSFVPSEVIFTLDREAFTSVVVSSDTDPTALGMRFHQHMLCLRCPHRLTQLLRRAVFDFAKLKQLQHTPFRSCHLPLFFLFFSPSPAAVLLAEGRVH